MATVLPLGILVHACITRAALESTHRPATVGCVYASVLGRAWKSHESTVYEIPYTRHGAFWTGVRRLFDDPFQVMAEDDPAGLDPTDRPEHEVLI
jgi:hypothetical protein